MFISAAFSILFTDDQTVVSVGPYIFHNSLERESKSFARSGGSGSPPQRSLILYLDFQPAVCIRRYVAGVACIMETFSVSIILSNDFPFNASSLEAINTFAPHINGRNISSPAISNERVVTASNVSCSEMPGL